MPKASVQIPTATPGRIANSARDAKARQASKIASLRDALVRNGYGTLQKQAAVLGISRSSAWYLLNGDYKGSGLSASTIKRILSSSTLPDEARQVIEEYVEERLVGAYGHAPARLKAFRKLVGYPEHPSGDAKQRLRNQQEL